VASIEAVQGLSQPAHGSVHVVDLLPAFQCLDDLLQRATTAAELVYGAPFSSDPYRGLYINQDEVTRLFSQSPSVPLFNSNNLVESEQVRERLHTALLKNPSLTWLARSFDLTLFDLDVILLTLATELDLRYERIIAYLQDDVTRRRPSVDLALNLFCSSADEKLARRANFAPEAPLIRQELIRLLPDQSHNAPPLLAHYLKLDEQITTLLLGQRTLDPRLSSFCEIRQPTTNLDALPLGSDVKQALRLLVLRARENSQPLRFHFSGSCKADKRLAAEAISSAASMPLLIVDLNRALTSEAEFERCLKRVFRQGQFQDAVVYLDGGDALEGDSRSLPARLLAANLLRFDGIAVIDATQRNPQVQTADSNESLGLIEVEFSIPGFPLRRECWQVNLQAANVNLAEKELELLAGRFCLTPAQVSHAVAYACNRSLWRTAADASPNTSAARPTLSDLCSAARTQSQDQLGTLARKIDPVYSWDDIVLPKEILDQLRELCSRVAQRHRVLGEWGFGRKLSLGKGTGALFAGPSGTGKTMAAEIVANELELDLYKIDLSGVVSKYIGETEKNLDRIFTTAENANAILFFDEADALFGKRSEVRDSHDRYANIEISYLLQKMEQYEGVAILATNLRQNLDEAFLRRLQFVVEFPFPDEVHRRRIWQTLFPPEAPRDKEIDFDSLAQQFRLAGGNIKNIVMGSAFLAAADGRHISMSHLLQSAKREYQKLGKTL
ncbi:MAG TPA: AAA family ATPase, partial [Pyrinomonadaceae bacterium]|nr:AAA family ATPase [Pyrinomonadaceae bacterium]